MKIIKILTQTAAVGLLIGGAALASAGADTWTFSGATFDDGTSLTGSFSYDADLDNVLSYSISVQSGSLPAVTYDMTDSYVDSYASNNPIVFNTLYGANELFIANNDGSSELLLDFASTPTDAGGTVALLTGGLPASLGTGSFENNGDASVTRYLTAGVVTTVSDVPEPSTRSFAFCGLACLALVGMRRRERN